MRLWQEKFRRGAYSTGGPCKEKQRKEFAQTLWVWVGLELRLGLRLVLELRLGLEKRIGSKLNVPL